MARKKAMKIFVVCDEHGDVRSVAVPNPALAGNLGIEPTEGGRVHVLDVDSRAMSRENLLDPSSEEARRKIYEKLRAMIARPEAPRPANRGKTERKRPSAK